MLLLVSTLFLSVLSSLVSGLSLREVRRELGPRLSRSALVSGNKADYARWSQYEAPSPGVIVDVATEEDVAATVKYCVKSHIPFLAQGGGHGWSTWDFDRDGILISLRRLNSVTFNDDKTEVTVGGGTLISEVIEAASPNNALVTTGNCNCVGAIGAILGAGYGNLMGLNGLGVDNILSLNLVTAKGVLKEVTPDNDPELFWALRGAGPNFGVVTSAKMKSYPVEPAGQYAWLGALTFTGDQVEKVIQAINDITLKPKMNLFLYFVTGGAPDFTPAVLITPFYYGTEAEGREAFASILDIGPVADTTAETHYTRWNEGAKDFCIKGGRKPSYNVGLTEMVPETWKQVWDEYVEWVSLNGTGNSIFLVEAYSMDKSRSFPDDSSSYAWRSTINFNAIAIPWYYDESLDSTAEAVGERVRDLWHSTDGLHSPATYINFAHGDEDASEIYGRNTRRLQKLKSKVDPHNVFNNWFNIKPRRGH